MAVFDIDMHPSVIEATGDCAMPIQSCRYPKSGARLDLEGGALRSRLRARRMGLLYDLPGVTFMK